MSLYDEETAKLPVTNSSEVSSTNSTKAVSDIESLNIISPNEIKNSNSQRLSYGRMITFYYVNNDPVFAIGPDCMIH